MGRRHGPRRLPTGLPPRPLPCISENAELMARCSAAPPFGCSSSLSPWPVGTEARCSRPLPACENEACSLSTHRKLHNARDSPLTLLASTAEGHPCPADSALRRARKRRRRAGEPFLTSIQCYPLVFLATVDPVGPTRR